jgi:hypothetical protein
MTPPHIGCDYQTVDVPVLNGRIQLEATCALMEQSGWRPIVLIAPDENYPHNSIVFEREARLL